MSFVSVPKESHFPIENLPFGIFSSEDNQNPRPCVAIGNFVLDIQKSIQTKNLFNSESTKHLANLFNETILNKFIDQTPEIWREVRTHLQQVLSLENAKCKDIFFSLKLLYDQDTVKMHLPIHIGDYTDFYSSKEHARNVGEMFRGKDNALLPNWLHLPVAYHGRASSVVVSETDVFRPNGQIKLNNESNPIFGPSKRLDFELEVAFIIGNKGNELGNKIDVKNADGQIFGMVLMNDWSARDIQKWEYVPLGPFLSKNFSTTISPWIVTLEALKQFRVKNVIQDPKPLSYLQHEDDCNFDINLQVFLDPKSSGEETLISQSNFKYMYWTMKQQVAHHSITGCNLRTGDLLGSGTISGPTKDSYGSLLELTWNGTQPLKLKNGDQRLFLEDFDKVVLTGYCDNGKTRLGFGKCVGKILPAKSI